MTLRPRYTASAKLRDLRALALAVTPFALQLAQTFIPTALHIITARHTDQEK